MTDRTRIVALTVAAATSFSAVHAVALSVQQNVALLPALFGASIYYGLLVGLSLPLWWICAWLGRASLPGWLSIATHFGLLASTVTAWLGAYSCLLYFAAGPRAFQKTLQYGGVWILLQSLTTYTLVVAGIVSLQNQQRLDVQRRKEAELRALAQQAELRALRAQLRPHFIFNVLNSIYALIPVSPDNAQRMVERVADLIRDTLEVTDQKLIPLEQELALVDRYLEIEALRVGDRLQLEKKIAPDVARWPVPPLILQPLVENAVKHGISRTTSPGHIHIQAQADNNRLTVRIKNSGPLNMGPRNDGMGLSITKNRLETMYGPQGRVDLVFHPDANVEVALTVPDHA